MPETARKASGIDQGLLRNIGPSNDAGLDLSLALALEQKPGSPVKGTFRGSPFEAQLAIPNYGARLARHFGRSPTELDPTFAFQHFGMIVSFENPTELKMHDTNRRLESGFCDLLARFGPIRLGNAYLPDGDRISNQRNVFPSLNFHIDRGHTQDDRHTLFWRDPLDAVQRHPRSSSTLVLPNAAAQLQAFAEGHGEREFNPRYDLFKKENPAPLIGDLLLELPWRAPEGVGEIAVLDNRTVLHASYYARPDLKGYPISVRYLY